ncbi:MAG: ABC-F family ATP-binding cassette domain-containing protein [Hyphomonadaceae bacterium]|nr:ABC-F family ATP-binding cassette domain-containing protein [Hyphomonadaceae bacterium]
MSRDLAQLKDVRLSLGGAPLFEGVDMALVKGERATLVGDNGAGKSTLIRILAREIDPDRGERTYASGALVAYVAQEPDLAGHETLRAYAQSPFGTAAPAPAHAAEAALESWGLDPDRAPRGLSGGEIRRAALARALAAEPDILLLDEPTNHLDIPAIEDLEQRLRAFSGAALIVSHDRRFLERVATACYWLRNGRVQRLDRGFAAFDAWAAGIEAGEARSFARLETHLAAEEHWLRRGVTARRSRNEGRRRKLEAMRAEKRQQKGQMTRSTAAMAAEKGGESGRLVLEARGVSKSFEGPAGPRPIVLDLSLKIMRGDRVGIVGPNGAGKTTLLDLLLQRQAPDAGQVRTGANLEIAYVDQMRATLDPAATIVETLCPLGGDQVMVRGKPRHVAAYAKDFLFTAAQLRQPTGALSGGERNRLALAAALAKAANLLVLDEPTNDLDMDTLDALEEMLAAYDGTVLIVSHDRAFLDGVTTQIVGALGGGRWAETPGGYADFEREHGGFRTPTRAAPERPLADRPASSPAAPARTQRKLSYKDERALADIEARLPALDAEIAALEARLADAGLFARDPRGFDSAIARLDAARAEKEAAEMAWLEIEERRAALGP